MIQGWKIGRLAFSEGKRGTQKVINFGVSAFLGLVADDATLIVVLIHALMSWEKERVHNVSTSLKLFFHDFFTFVSSPLGTFMHLT